MSVEPQILGCARDDKGEGGAFWKSVGDPGLKNETWGTLIVPRGSRFRKGRRDPRALNPGQFFDEFAMLGISLGELGPRGQLEICKLKAWRYGATYQRKPHLIFQPRSKPAACFHHPLKSLAGNWVPGATPIRFPQDQSRRPPTRSRNKNAIPHRRQCGGMQKNLFLPGGSRSPSTPIYPRGSPKAEHCRRSSAPTYKWHGKSRLRDAGSDQGDRSSTARFGSS